MALAERARRLAGAVRSNRQRRVRDRYFANADAKSRIGQLGDQYFLRGEWPEAVQQYRTVMRAVWPFDVPTFDDVRTGIIEDQGIDAELVDSVFARAAYAVAKLGNLTAALAIAEEGRSGRLRDTVALSNLPEEARRSIEEARANLQSLRLAMLKAGRDMMWTPAEVRYGEVYCAEHVRLRTIISEIIKRRPRFEYPRLQQSELLEAIPGQGAAVIPIITNLGSIVFVIPGGTHSVGQHHALWLPHFTTKTLRHFLLGTDDDPGFHQASYASALSLYLAHGGTFGRSGATHFNWDRWGAARLTGRLWEELLGEVHAKLRELDVPSGAQIVFVTDGSAVMPLHSAWRQVGSEPKYFADEYVSSYAPNFYGLHRIQTRLARHRPKRNRLVAVVDPTGDLPSAQLELKGLSDAWTGGQLTTLTGADATLPSLMEHLPGSTHLHFACHGFRDWVDGSGSGVILAGHDELTAQQISGLDLSDVRLVVLSSCETGAIDYIHSQTEWTGLPEAFLESGALGVICSVWAVDDVASALLMQQLYHQLLGGQEDHATALHDAQMWLKRTTAGELRLSDLWGERYKLSNGRDQHAESLQRYFKAHPDSVPFSDPYYWAGFILVGA